MAWIFQLAVCLALGYGSAALNDTIVAAEGAQVGQAKHKTLLFQHAWRIRGDRGDAFISQCYNWTGGLGDNPIFHSELELRAAGWAPYFEAVYGEVPHSRYPICMGSFWFINQAALLAAEQLPQGGQLNIDKCPRRPGDWYRINNKYQPTWASWIFHPPPYGVDGSGLPGDTWVEVSHEAEPREVTGTWFMFSMGSGVWFNLGKTIVFNDHGEAHEKFCGRCKNGTGNKDAQMSVAAAAQGYTSIQFVRHPDDQWRCKGGHGSLPKGAMNIEIVAVALNGYGPCGENPSAFKAGWNADKPCNCDPKAQFLNCQV